MFFLLVDMATTDNPLEIEYLPRVLPEEHRVGIRSLARIADIVRIRRLFRKGC